MYTKQLSTNLECPFGGIQLSGGVHNLFSPFNPILDFLKFHLNPCYLRLNDHRWPSPISSFLHRKLFHSVNPGLRNRNETPKIHISYHYLGCFDEVDEHIGTFLHWFFRDNSGSNPRAQLKKSNKIKIKDVNSISAKFKLVSLSITSCWIAVGRPYDDNSANESSR